MKDNRAKISDARTGGNPKARGGYVSPRVVMLEIKTHAHIPQSSTDVKLCGTQELQSVPCSVRGSPGAYKLFSFFPYLFSDFIVYLQ